MTRLLSILLVSLAAAALTVTAGQNPARADSDAKPITVHLQVPADARVLIDGTPTTTAGEDREFVTPPVAAGRAYSYTLTVTSAGKTVKREITFRHGAENRFDLRDAFATAESRTRRQGRPPQIINGGPTREPTGAPSPNVTAGPPRSTARLYYAPTYWAVAPPPPPGAGNVNGPEYALYNPEQFGSTDILYDPLRGGYQVYNPVNGSYSGPFYSR